MVCGLLFLVGGVSVGSLSVHSLAPRGRASYPPRRSCVRPCTPIVSVPTIRTSALEVICVASPTCLPRANGTKGSAMMFFSGFFVTKRFFSSSQPQSCGTRFPFWCVSRLQGFVGTYFPRRNSTSNGTKVVFRFRVSIPFFFYHEV